MSFQTNDKVCVVVEPTRKSPPDFDVGEVVRVWPPLQYDIARECSNNVQRHLESHLFTLKPNERKSKKLQTKGWWADVVWENVDGKYLMEATLNFHKSGTPVKVLRNGRD